MAHSAEHTTGQRRSAATAPGAPARGVLGAALRGRNRPRPALSGLGPVALLPVAAFAVHQLRYWLAFGTQAGLELDRQGHSYLHSVVPWIVLLAGVALGLFLRALGRALGGQRSLTRYGVSFAALWLICTASLMAIYVAQELLEGMVATGHPAGLVGVFGYGGWWSLPAALCVGLVLAAAFHGARWVLSEVIRRRLPRPAGQIPAGSASLAAEDVFIARLAPLAGGWSGRGPPA